MATDDAPTASPDPSDSSAGGSTDGALDDRPAAGASSSASPIVDAPADLPAERLLHHGAADRARGLDPAPFETALAEDAARRRVDESLERVRSRIDRVEDRIDEVRSLREDVAGAKAEIDEMSSARETAEQELDDAETRLEAVREKQSARRSRGSVLYAALYTAAGLLFVAGDVILSREIVASALKLGGTAEPWIFAVGLAMLAVLLKPAYDRLVETRYWDGKTGAFQSVIVACSVVAIATLGVLGAFRSTALRADTRIERLSSRLAQATDPAAIERIQEQIASAQQSVANSPMGYWSFVLSGVLFAVAGAVCLGIGIRHLRDAYHLRYRLYRARRRLEDERDDAAERLDRLREQLPERRVALRTLQQRLADAPDLAALRERRAALRDRESALLDERADLRSRRRQALYRRGYDRGEGAVGPNAPADGPRTNGSGGPRAGDASGGRPDASPRSLLGRSADGSE
jgi:hypothetical protein